MEKEKILGFNVSITEEEDLLNKIYDDYNKNIKNFIVNVNPEIVLKNYKNKDFVEKLNSQNYQIPDGIGIVWASKKNKGKIKTRITGIDFMKKICEKSINNNAKIFLYGSKEGIAKLAKQELEKDYKNICIVGVCDGYVDEKIAIEKIKNSNADILFVGLGSPKQEQFILDNMKNLENIKIFMPIGGSLDVISKTLKRAPNWMIKCNIEWLYRLIKQPKRLFRQLKIFKFVFLVLKNKNMEVKNG